MDRRGFVKTATGIAGAAALGATAYAVGGGLVSPREALPGPVHYIGAHKVGGPAPRGVPYIPITVKDGVFVAKTEPFTHERKTYDPLDWHAFCRPRTQPNPGEGYTGDRILRYQFPEESQHFITPWYADRLGEPVRPDDFPGAGFGARFTWGSLDGAALTGIIVGANPSNVRRIEAPLQPGKPLDEAAFAFVQREIFHESFIAASNVCTHFCCHAGYKEAERLARPRNAWERMYCTCHSAVFELREPAWYAFEKGIVAT